MGCSELTLADFSFMEKDPNYATLYVKANDGSYFVGYEEDDACAVYDACGAPILHIDRLKLSLDNGIQSVMFSDDSKLLLLWRNLSVQVIELRTGKLLSDIRVASKPVYGVKFAEDSKHIQITFIDGTFCVVGVYDSKRRQKEDLPKEINKKRDYLNVGPYSTCIYQEKPYVNRLLTQNWSDIIWEYRSDRWLKNNRIYDAGSVFLWYNDGEFYLNGEETQRFDHPGIDFAKSHQLEQMHDPSYLRAFLREKNDVMSQLIVCDENHLILVSRMLGSIIVFDTKKMAVSAAYKHRGDIVGCTVLSRTELEIISCTIPYKTRYRLFIED